MSSRTRWRCCWSARGGSCARKLAENFAYGTHSFTDAIDGDGHGSGPLQLRLSADTREGQRRRGPLHLRRHRDGRPVGRAGQFPDESRRAGNGARALLPRRRSRPGLQRGRPAGAGRGAAARGLAALAEIPRASGHARAHHDAPARHAERPRQCGWRRRARLALRLCHLDHARLLPHRRRRAADRSCWPTASASAMARGPMRTGSTPSISSRRRTIRSSSSSSATRCGCATYGVVEDSGGAGRYRGGCGIIREYEILAEEVVMAIRIDCVKNPPWGIAGGMSRRRRASRRQSRARTARSVFAPLSDGNMLRRGDILRIETGGGGGYGHPHDRPAEDVLKDVLGGFVSRGVGRAALRRRDPRLRDGPRRDSRASRRPAIRSEAFHRNEYVDALG